MPPATEETASGPNPRAPAHRDPALDGLRGAAILLVYLFHYGGGLRSANPAARAAGYVTQAGWTGVDVFFALSGFLITGLLWENLGQPHSLRNFYGRRALRIAPVYYGALILAAVAALVRGSAGAHPARLRPLLLYAGFLQNIPGLVQHALHYPRPLPLHHLWSLAVEEQYYLLWPFLLLAAGTRRRALHLCLWVFAISFLFRVIVYTPHLVPAAADVDWSGFLLTRAGALALGSALALTVAAKHRLRRWAIPGLVAGLGIFIAAGALSGTFVLSGSAQFIFGLPAVDIASVALVVLALEAGLWRSLLSTAPMRLLGRISYAFYVLHILLEPLFDHIGRWAVHASTGSSYQLVRFVAGFPITVAAATLSWFLLERPFLRLKRLFPRKPAASV